MPQAGIVTDPEDTNDQPTLARNDGFSERAVTAPPDDVFPPDSNGEARLDAHGQAEIHADPPPNLPGARYVGALGNRRDLRRWPERGRRA